MLLELVGVLGATAEGEVTDAVDDALQHIVGVGGDLVLVDLTAVTRLGTLGLATLLRAQEAAEEIRGIDLAINAPPASIAVR
ncbi:STAS domain-containing protein [Actinokineospora cianjurensis]|uniref:STAS domain-containing protein n=2 Tax=Actinokineospora cianjurensis TaxID=585224 RepID=A0A421AX66_9PSEU|nr:STAS domain-containing protein [Actinokineospora cianjurensis]